VIALQCIQRLVDAVAGCYAVPNLSARGYACKTNLPPCDAAMLGNGVAQAVFFTEHCIRAVADFLNVPVAVVCYSFVPHIRQVFCRLCALYNVRYFRVVM